MNKNDEGPNAALQKNRNIYVSDRIQLEARTELALEIDICEPNDLFDHKRFKVVQKLSYGSYGQIYLAFDSIMQQEIALKVELASNNTLNSLPLELMVMKSYQGKPHAADLIGAGTHGNINYIAMTLVGENLATLRRLCPIEPNRFSFGTCMRLSFQCLESIRDLHSIFVIHRDIKPSNFAMGLKDSIHSGTVYLLDFGLSRFYVNSTGQMRPPRPVAGFRGTLRYCSIATHQRRDLCRKDDIISLFYMMVEWFKGSLPWHSLSAMDDVQKSKLENCLENLVDGLPKSLDTFVKHIESLEYADKPDYALLLEILNDMMQKRATTSDDYWDWDERFATLLDEERILLNM